MMNSLRNWLEIRIGFEELLKTYGTENRVPQNVRILSTLGFVSFAGFVIQAVTGILLMIYYVPHADHAFASVQSIMTAMPFGWLFRMIHVVGGNLLVATVFLHMLTVFFMGNYKRPRELTWVGGALMLYLVVMAGLTGSLLPWSQLGYWSTTMVTAMPQAVPVMGGFLTKLFRGGEHITGITLNRFFALHVAVIPMFILILGVLHYFLLRRIGLSATPFGLSDAESRVWTSYHRKTHPDGPSYFPDFFLKQLMMTFLYVTVIFFAMTFLQDVFLQPDASIPADPQKTPLNVRPAWYFLAPYQLLKMMPNKFLGATILAALVGVFLFWPFLDVQKEKNVFKRPVLRGAFFVLMVLWIVLLFWGRR